MTDYLNNAANIAGATYKSDPSLVDAELFGNLKKDVGENPRGIGRNLLKGALSGLEYGSKLKASDKFNKNMEWIQSISEDATRERRKLEKRNFALQNAKPSVMALMKSLPNLDPTAQRTGWEQVLQKYNTDSGEEIKLISVDSVDPTKVVLSNNGKIIATDILTLFSSDEELSKEWATKRPEYIEKQQYERGIKERELGIMERKLNQQDSFEQSKLGLEERKVAVEENKNKPREVVDYSNLPVNQNGFEYVPYTSLSKKGQEKAEQDAMKVAAQIPVNERTIVSGNQIKDILRSNPELGNSLHLINNSPDDETTFSILRRKFGNTKTIAAVEKIQKLIADLTYSTIQGVSGGKPATDLFKKIIQTKGPKIGSTEEAATFVIDKIIKEANENNDLAKAKFLGMQSGQVIMGRAKRNPNNPNNSMNNSSSGFHGFFGDIGKKVG